MQNSKTVMNLEKNNFVLDDVVVAKLKQIILSILIDVANSCEKRNVPYYLAYGTLLGAVRNQGFIPWDDDIDIFVPYKNLKDVVNAMKDDYGDKYFFSGLYPDDSNDPVCQLKIMVSGTKMIELQNSNRSYIRGIGIDVFPLVSVPKHKFSRLIYAKKVNFLKHAVSLTGEFKEKPQILLNSNDSKVQKYYKLRQFLGFLLSFKRPTAWLKRYKSLISKTWKKSDFYSSADAIRVKDPLDSNDIAMGKVIFEGHTLSCFINYKKELIGCYGKDYMVPTPVGQREVHVLYDIDFGKN